MEKKVVNTLISTAALTGAVIAGPVSEPEAAPAPTPTCSSYCDALKSIGKVYKDKSNPFIQEVSFFGRLQYQVASVHGEDVYDNDFHQDFDEFRRVRAGVKVKMLHGLQLKANANIMKDNSPKGGSRSWGYDSLDEATLSYTLKDVAGFDKVGISYGRHKVAVGHEAHTSSKKIKTIERSAISNTIYDGRYTGVKLKLKRGDFAGTLGVFSTDSSKEIAGWSDGIALYFSTTADVMGNEVLFDFFYNLDQGTAKSQVHDDVEWVASAAWERDFNGWNVMINAIYGDHGDQGSSAREGGFWGLVVQPSKFIIEDKLEAVLQYQYQGSSEAEGVRGNSRYISRLESKDSSININSRRGDSHHSIYAGLNYYLCGHRSKFMTGVSYDMLDTPQGDVSAATLWGAYRMYF